MKKTVLFFLVLVLSVVIGAIALAWAQQKAIQPVLPTLQQSPGIPGWVRVFSSLTHTIPAWGRANTVVTCPAGKKVLGGGFVIAGGSGTEVVASLPSSDGTSWTVQVLNWSSGSKTLSVDAHAICATCN